ncbi:hypothetical protein XA26_27870 [Mycolicibacterium fortuitum]|uniref:Uncharacterized protein n=1 Tax=Mycolicibacterium fortuitum TaxID=1766 RepID=A0A0N9Y1D5_MYCFO|nr:hypothetical protein XA26_27870 [Mycolicibacterium fortuitum]
MAQHCLLIFQGRRDKERESSLVAEVVCRRRMGWSGSAAVSWPRSP